MRCLVQELGADVKQPDTEGLTPLCRAVFGRNLNLIRFLIEELGADVKQADTKKLRRRVFLMWCAAF
jgi:ankyrin repeat protein